MPNKYSIDCNGLVCPLPVAKTRKKLSELKSGEILEIFGDFGDSGENIVVFCESQGYKILKCQIEKDKYHIKIQKE